MVINGNKDEVWFVGVINCYVIGLLLFDSIVCY